MPTAVSVLIHSSQFPDQVRNDLLESLRSRQVNHKFHYDSVKQTQKWLALHQIYSPSRHDADCAATYDSGFQAAARGLNARRVHLIGLGCGGGQKDARLLAALAAPGRELFYTPCDVSAAMVLVARQAAVAVIPGNHCFPVVCDLSAPGDLADALEKTAPDDAVRLFAFFGMIPNFEPGNILPKLARLIGARDGLLFSANLSPGPDYSEGMRRILPQYDNEPTREWLLTFLLDLGVARTDGELRFQISADPDGLGLNRVEARFHFRHSCRVRVETEEFAFASGESIRLFFSYRYTPELVRGHLARHQLRVAGEWITGSQEEGVFLVARD